MTPIMQHWFGEHSMLGNRTALTILISILFIIPLGTMPSISMLRYSSFLTFLSMIFMTIAIVIRYNQQVGQISSVQENQGPVLWNWSWEALRAAPIVWYNSGFIFQAIPVLAQNDAQFTRNRIAAIMLVVTVIVSALMLTLGIPGYMTFFERTNGNVLTNYAMDDPLMGVCRALVTVVVVCSYPLFNLPLREALFYLFQQFQEWKQTRDALAASAKKVVDIPSHESDGSEIGENSSKDALGMKSTTFNPNATHYASGDANESSSGYFSSFSNDSYLTQEHNLHSDTDGMSASNSEQMVRLDIDGSAEDDAEIAQIPDDSLGPIVLPEPSLRYQQTQVSDEEKVNLPISERPFAVYSRTFIQTFVTWIFAFTLAYVIPDITVVISFVASTFSPIYYFCLPAMVALSLPDKTSKTKMGAYLLFGCCALFLVAGWATYFLPKNVVSPALPSSPKTTTPHTS